MNTISKYEQVKLDIAKQVKKLEKLGAKRGPYWCFQQNNIIKQLKFERDSIKQMP